MIQNYMKQKIDDLKQEIDKEKNSPTKKKLSAL